MRKLILSTSWNQECLQQGTPYFFEVRQPKSRGFVMFAKRRMCRKRSFQNWGSQNWSQTNLDQKFKFNSNKNVCLENWKLKENRYKLFDSNFLISYKKFPWFFIGKHPLFNFLTKNGWAMSIFEFLLLRPCTLLVVQTSQNLFRFFSKLFLDFGLGKKWLQPYRKYLVYLFLSCIDHTRSC